MRIRVATKYDLAEEFFRWEIATAIAGAILGINPFNQPDVEASKIATRALTSEYEKTGKLPAETPFFEGEGVKLFADAKNAEALQKARGDVAVAGRVPEGPPRPPGQGRLLRPPGLRAHERGATRRRCRRRGTACATRSSVATCLGFGPRFLHSTGRPTRADPNSGVFLQVTCDDAEDLPVPGQKYTFGVVKAAQARGDFQVLAERDRRALRVHLGPDVAAGLATLERGHRQGAGR